MCRVMKLLLIVHSSVDISQLQLQMIDYTKTISDPGFQREDNHKQAFRLFHSLLK